jgi:hypothetical protein
LALTVALFSTGVLPAALARSATEVETCQHEGPTSVYGEVLGDVRCRLRRPSPQRCDACAFSALFPEASRRLAHASACELAFAQLSLGLSVPLRC